MSMRKHLLYSLFAALVALMLTNSPAAAQAQGGIRGKVRDAKGKAIANAVVAARQDSKNVKTTKTNSKGEFRLEGLRPGTYNVAIEADGFSTGVKYDVRVGTKVINLGDRLILSVDEGSLVLIRGSVFTKQGRSVPGAKVELFIVGPNGSAKRIATGFTTGSGDFGFRRPKGKATLKLVASYRKAVGEKILEVEFPEVYRTAITIEFPQSDK